MSKSNALDLIWLGRLQHLWDRSLVKLGSKFGSKRRREAACKTHSLCAVSAQRTHRAATNQKEQPAPHLRAAREKLSPKNDVGWTLREDAATRGSQVAQEASGFRKVTDRKAMRFVPARPRFVMVAANHALRLLDARIRRIFGRSVERHVFDVWPRRSVAVRGGAAALRVSLADATRAAGREVRWQT